MEDYPTNLMDFESRFSTEEACRDYLFKLRWPNGFTCPMCHCRKGWPVRKVLYQCSNCGYQASVIAGTIFQNTHKPLVLWFRAIWWVTSQKNGASALGLKRILGLGSYKTAWTWLHKLRCAMVRPGRDKLSGTIEVDETYIGGKKPGKRGRGATGKSLVVVAVEDKGRHFGRIRLCRVVNASADSLIPAVQESIKRGSNVRTDGWRGYAQLSSKGYNHSVIRQSVNVGDNLLPLTNRVVALLKSWLQGTHQGSVKSSHLDYYLDEFTFRFNRRTSHYRGKLFYRLLQQAVIIPPTKGQDIRGGRTNS